MGVFDFGGLSADTLVALIEDEGLDIEDLSIEVDDDGNVSVYGTAADESTQKKAIKLLKNAEGVTSVDDQLEIYEGDDDEEYDEDEDDEEYDDEETVADSNIYTVKYGDTLWGIAEKFYGDGSKYMKIFEANRHLWKAHNNDPNVLYPNWELTIP